jgi:phenolic acid decarboxylase
MSFLVLKKNSNTVTLEQSGGVVVGSYIEIQQENNPALMYTDPLWDVSWAEESVGQMFKVIAVNGNVVTLDRPVFLPLTQALLWKLDHWV